MHRKKRNVSDSSSGGIDTATGEEKHEPVTSGQTSILLWVSGSISPSSVSSSVQLYSACRSSRAGVF